MPTAVEADCLVAVSTSTSSSASSSTSKSTECSLRINNLDPGWPTAELVAARGEEGKWVLGSESGGKGKVSGWVSYVAGALEVSLETTFPRP